MVMGMWQTSMHMCSVSATLRSLLNGRRRGSPSYMRRVCVLPGSEQPSNIMLCTHAVSQASLDRRVAEIRREEKPVAQQRVRLDPIFLNASRRPPRPGCGCGALFRKAATRKPSKAHRPETRNCKPQTVKLKPSTRNPKP